MPATSSKSRNSTKINELRAQGNALFKEGRWQDAVDAYTEAIRIVTVAIADSSDKHPPKQHDNDQATAKATTTPTFSEQQHQKQQNVLVSFYSNRSAAYLKLGKLPEALQDAQECIAVKPNYAKGYSRQGAVFLAMQNFDHAVETFQQGLSNCGCQQEQQQEQPEHHPTPHWHHHREMLLKGLETAQQQQQQFHHQQQQQQQHLQYSPQQERQDCEDYHHHYQNYSPYPNQQLQQQEQQQHYILESPFTPPRRRRRTTSDRFSPQPTQYTASPSPYPSTPPLLQDPLSPLFHSLVTAAPPPAYLTPPQLEPPRQSHPHPPSPSWEDDPVRTTAATPTAHNNHKLPSLTPTMIWNKAQVARKRSLVAHRVAQRQKKRQRHHPCGGCGCCHSSAARDSGAATASSHQRMIASFVADEIAGFVHRHHKDLQLQIAALQSELEFVNLLQQLQQQQQQHYKKNKTITATTTTERNETPKAPDEEEENNNHNDEAQLQLLFQVVDRDRDGTISAKELSMLLKQNDALLLTKHKNRSNRVRRRHSPKPRRRLVTTPKRVFTVSSSSWYLDQAIATVAIFDTDGDARLNYHEFSEYIRVWLAESLNHPQQEKKPTPISLSEFAEYLILQSLFAHDNDNDPADHHGCCGCSCRGVVHYRKRSPRKSKAATSTQPNEEEDNNVFNSSFSSSLQQQQLEDEDDDDCDEIVDQRVKSREQLLALLGDERLWELFDLFDKHNTGRDLSFDHVAATLYQLTTTQDDTMEPSMVQTIMELLSMIGDPNGDEEEEEEKEENTNDRRFPAALNYEQFGRLMLGIAAIRGKPFDEVADQLALTLVTRSKVEESNTNQDWKSFFFGRDETTNSNNDGNNNENNDNIQCSTDKCSTVSDGMKETTSDPRVPEVVTKDSVDGSASICNLDGDNNTERRRSCSSSTQQLSQQPKDGNDATDSNEKEIPCSTQQHSSQPEDMMVNHAAGDHEKEIPCSTQQSSPPEDIVNDAAVDHEKEIPCSTQQPSQPEDIVKDAADDNEKEIPCSTQQPSQAEVVDVVNHAASDNEKEMTCSTQQSSKPEDIVNDAADENEKENTPCSAVVVSDTETNDDDMCTALHKKLENLFDLLDTGRSGSVDRRILEEGLRRFGKSTATDTTSKSTQSSSSSIMVVPLADRQESNVLPELFSSNELRLTKESFVDSVAEYTKQHDRVDLRELIDILQLTAVTIPELEAKMTRCDSEDFDKNLDGIDTEAGEKGSQQTKSETEHTENNRLQLHLVSDESTANSFLDRDYSLSSLSTKNDETSASKIFIVGVDGEGQDAVIFDSSRSMIEHPLAETKIPTQETEQQNTIMEGKSASVTVKHQNDAENSSTTGNVDSSGDDEPEEVFFDACSVVPESYDTDQDKSIANDEEIASVVNPALTTEAQDPEEKKQDESDTNKSSRNEELSSEQEKELEGSFLNSRRDTMVEEQPNQSLAECAAVHENKAKPPIQNSQSGTNEQPGGYELVTKSRINAGNTIEHDNSERNDKENSTLEQRHTSSGSTPARGETTALVTEEQQRQPSGTEEPFQKQNLESEAGYQKQEETIHENTAQPIQKNEIGTDEQPGDNEPGGASGINTCSTIENDVSKRTDEKSHASRGNIPVRVKTTTLDTEEQRQLCGAEAPFHEQNPGSEAGDRKQEEIIHENTARSIQNHETGTDEQCGGSDAIAESGINPCCKIENDASERIGEENSTLEQHHTSNGSNPIRVETKALDAEEQRQLCGAEEPFQKQNNESEAGHQKQEVTTQKFIDFDQNESKIIGNGEVEEVTEINHEAVVHHNKDETSHGDDNGFTDNSEGQEASAKSHCGEFETKRGQNTEFGAESQKEGSTIQQDIDHRNEHSSEGEFHHQVLRNNGDTYNGDDEGETCGRDDDDQKTSAGICHGDFETYSGQSQQGYPGPQKEEPTIQLGIDDDRNQFKILGDTEVDVTGTHHQTAFLIRREETSHGDNEGQSGNNCNYDDPKESAGPSNDIEACCEQNKECKSAPTNEVSTTQQGIDDDQNRSEIELDDRIDVNGDEGVNNDSCDHDDQETSAKTYSDNFETNCGRHNESNAGPDKGESTINQGIDEDKNKSKTDGEGVKAIRGEDSTGERNDVKCNHDNDETKPETINGVCGQKGNNTSSSSGGQETVNDVPVAERIPGGHEEAQSCDEMHDDTKIEIRIQDYIERHRRADSNVSQGDSDGFYSAKDGISEISTALDSDL